MNGEYGACIKMIIDFPVNRSHVELSLLSSSDETGIIVWDELGNIGVDKMHGNIILSQNSTRSWLWVVNLI